MTTPPIPEPLYDGKTFYQYIMAIAVEMTGDPAANPITAFAQWQNERDAMAELYNENEDLKKRNRTLTVALALAEKAIERAEHDAAMFITQATRDIIQKFRNQIEVIHEQQQTN